MYTQQAIGKILKQVAKRTLSPRKAFQRLKNLPYENLNFAKVDHHRHFRKGYPEAIYSPGKTVKQLIEIVGAVQKSGQPVLMTRLDQKKANQLSGQIPEFRYHESARIGYLGKIPKPKSTRAVGIVTGGTSDLPVAEEAAMTLSLMGRSVRRFYDCGVAGLHRLFDHLPAIQRCRVIVCVAGMEGALPSVLAGLVIAPVIAVPTNVGYGASYRGIAPLLAMLNSCSQGVSVVNIDNGFGAGCFAASVLGIKK